MKCFPNPCSICSGQVIAKRPRNAQGNPNASKDFYDETISAPVPAFPSVRTANPSFRNGVLHMHQDDDTHQLTWKL